MIDSAELLPLTEGVNRIVAEAKMPVELKEIHTELNAFIPHQYFSLL